MKLAAFLVAFAVAGLDAIAASLPEQQGLATEPGRVLPKHGIHLVWDPAETYQDHGSRRTVWQQRCEQALMNEGCGAGKVHKGETGTNRDGKRTSYLKVEGAPSMGMEYEKKLYVFRDGTSEDVTSAGWSRRDRKLMKEAKRLKKSKLVREREKKIPIVWDPVDAYAIQPKRRKNWEKRCREALAREGCAVGMIHQSTIKAVRDGVKTFYLNVEGGPSIGMKYGKKLHVFRDGTSEDVTEAGWSKRERKSMTAARRPNKDTQAQKAQEAEQGNDPIMSWDPADAYTKYQPQKRKYWEERCHQVLARKGCGTGIVHKGEIKVTRNGKKTSYVNVEGQGGPSMGKAQYRKMRVFQDGTSEDVTEKKWPLRDRRHMREAKRGQQKTNQTPPNGSTEASIRAQLPPQVSVQMPNHRDGELSWMAQEARMPASKRRKMQPTKSMGETEEIASAPVSTHVSTQTATPVPTEGTYAGQSQAPGKLKHKFDLNFPPDWEGFDPI